MDVLIRGDVPVKAFFYHCCVLWEKNKIVRFQDLNRTIST